MAADTEALNGAAGGMLCAGRDVLGQPRGVLFIGGTEFWERISFHGMLAILVLYVVDRLLLPGHVEHIIGFAAFRGVIEAVTGPLSSQALASQIVGLYIGLVYLTPVFGGLLGDRVIGRRRAVALGALLMTAGHFCMAFESCFVIGLLLLVLGAGALRGNLVSQFGDLYDKSDRRRDTGFQIYYFLLNSGGFIAPLITGALSQGWGWHYGFGFAGIGMLVGLTLYLSGGRFRGIALHRGAPRAGRDLGRHRPRQLLAGRARVRGDGPGVPGLSDRGVPGPSPRDRRVQQPPLAALPALQGLPAAGGRADRHDHHPLHAVLPDLGRGR